MIICSNIEQLDGRVKNMTDTDVTVLVDIKKTLDRNPDARQREIAQGTNLSIGMTNAILKRFVAKGWICLKKLNARTMQYMVTPAGATAVSKRSYTYFKRTFTVVQTYKEQIEQIVIKAKTDGLTQVLLAGDSDLQFVIEWACQKHGLPLSVVEKAAATSSYDDQSLVFVAEKGDSVEAGPNRVQLIELINRDDLL